eukprot:219104-Pleurochrysis_carterae.AAC.1
MKRYWRAMMMGKFHMVKVRQFDTPFGQQLDAYHRRLIDPAWTSFDGPARRAVRRARDGSRRGGAVAHGLSALGAPAQGARPGLRAELIGGPAYQCRQDTHCCGVDSTYIAAADKPQSIISHPHRRSSTATTCSSAARA